MKYTIIIILFFAYNFLLFFINNIDILYILTFTNLLLLIITKTKIKKYLKFILTTLSFITIILIFNTIFLGIYEGIKISIKLLLAVTATYIITNNISKNNFTEGFYYLLYPLKLFKADIKNLSLTITVALTFIPILSDEAKNIKLALLSKGLKFNLKNVLTRPHIFLLTYLNCIFKKVDDLELALKSKGFN